MKQNELLAEAIMQGEQLNNANEVLVQINTIIQTLNNKDIDKWSGDELSRACVKLALLMSNLGEMVAMYTADSNSKYIYRKFKTAKEYKKLRGDINSKVKDSELQAVENTKEEYEQEIISSYLADLLKTKYDEINRLIMVIQSRLSYMKSEQKNLHGGNLDS